MNNQNQNNTSLSAVTAAVAAASNTPFRTAFKITLGIAAGHLVAFLAACTLVAATGLALFLVFN